MLCMLFKEKLNMGTNTKNKPEADLFSQISSQQADARPDVSFCLIQWEGDSSAYVQFDKSLGV